MPDNNGKEKGTLHQGPWPKLPKISDDSAKSSLDMSDHPTRSEIDAKLGKISAETDTKIVRIEGKLDLVISKLDGVLQDNADTRTSIREEQRSTRANVWAVGVGLAAIIIAMAVAFPTFFGMGVQIKDVAAQTAKDEVHQLVQPSPPQSSKISPP